MLLSFVFWVGFLERSTSSKFRIMWLGDVGYSLQMPEQNSVQKYTNSPRGTTGLFFHVRKLPDTISSKNVQSKACT